jgi:magnesium chelatase accessory protein
MSLAAMAAALEALLAALGRGRPALVAGHSAGAAVAVRWALDAPRPPRAIVGFNPSLLAPPAVYMRLIAPLVNPLAMSSPFARFVAALGGSDRLVNSLLDATRSDVPAVQRERYARLFRDPVHVRGTMGFMAAADLTTLAVDARALAVPTTFVIGDDDPWVPARPLRRLIARAMPQAKVVVWHGGHVLHEAFPARAATLLRAALAAVAG